MREFIVTPIEKQRYDGHIDFPTQHKLALQARQSTKEQRLHNMESYESQTTVLLEHALDMGWQGLEVDIIPFLENKRPDGKIVDASGTKEIDQRPTMQDLWYHIEHDIVKAVMTRGVDRLFRHIDMIEPAMFAKLCKQHHCMIITVKEVRHRTKIEVYNFHENPEDTGAFLAEAQAGADFIINQIEWMNRCKLNKGMRGEYDGRNVPVGFILEKENYTVYEPHAAVVRWIFRRYHALSGNFTMVKREIEQRIRERGYLFPFFPDSMRHLRVSLEANGEGYTISATGLKWLLTNVAYVGIWQVYETIDRGTDNERRVLRASIEDHHPVIVVDEHDFWYAHDRLTEQDTPRSRYSKVGTTPAPALLEGMVAAGDGLAVYVFQNAQEPDSAAYVIQYTKELTDNRIHGTIYVKELDQIFTDHLLEKLEAGKRLQDQFAGEDPQEWILDGMENAMALRLIEMTKVQEVSTAGIDAKIAECSEEAENLDYTLTHGAKKLSPKKVEEYSDRLNKLETTIAHLTAKKKKAQRTQESLAKFANKLLHVPSTWKGMELENQRQFVELVTDKITLSKPAPNWLQLRIRWFYPGEPDSVCYIWQRQGTGEAWTDEENMILRRLYPGADRASILSALSRRSWSAMITQAYKKGISRDYQGNSSPLHKMLSVEDAAFMAQVGLAFSPGRRVWWVIASETSEGSSW